ncbi:hypothetical protein B0H15DRAFT_966299 [Mycena belliarum]|uniref:Brain protein I3 n=1 Tax=Mycena belliarum TaxID=1033014 RepID=A0AAD6TMF7_9AGAR|nr:hypothetical protein B0H15DRAFT_966299 [Mycena belliae]
MSTPAPPQLEPHAEAPTPAYTPAPAPPAVYQAQEPQKPYEYAPQPPQPPQGYKEPLPQGYAAQPQMMNPAQAGEMYRAQLFAQCAQGIHQPSTKYGMCGIITAVLCFPCGLIALFIDTEQKCDRCGIKLDQS